MCPEAPVKSITLAIHRPRHLLLFVPSPAEACFKSAAHAQNGFLRELLFSDARIQGESDAGQRTITPA